MLPHTSRRITDPYPAEWFDGSVWEVEMGVDLVQTNWRDVQATMRRAARKKGLRLRMQRGEGRLFYLQASPR